ncbi:hypothetical protein A1Q_4823 [Vibrio campbellii HY01]|nr:hypothetical protein A1Q_4823 [Vibrio campbellii HY01]
MVLVAHCDLLCVTSPEAILLQSLLPFLFFIDDSNSFL